METTVEKKEADNKGLNALQVVDPSASADKEAEERERQVRELKSGLHPLKHKFAFWYTRRTPGVRSQAYEDNIKKIVEFSTVEGFWVCYCHLARPSSLPSPTDLHLFKEGIRPLWEDAANCNGGKWIIRFRKVVSGRFWEDLVRKHADLSRLILPMLHVYMWYILQLAFKTLLLLFGLQDCLFPSIALPIATLKIHGITIRCHAAFTLDHYRNILAKEITA
ncbi:eukaryotic translation initiation factor NCBP-like [Telopea speciosissima]|uniref:eukaryotic translation initiation factor NCBP-like n=1 Tax=Telopea speciosissima TaxID=54955 RepID=UPI001CC828A6|nr:eukaryotic translation initiation factor NCBP-like [Telopea speciosissima]